MHFWGVSEIKAEVRSHFNEMINPKETMNDCSDGIFGVVAQDFPDSEHGQCYYYMIANPNKKYSKYFKSNLNKSRIVKYLKSMQRIGFANMNESSCGKLKKKILPKSFSPRNLSSLIGIVIASFGLALIWVSVILVQIMD